MDSQTLDPTLVASLSDLEATFLSMLVETNGAPLTREELRERCGLASARSVDFTIRRLRQKIETDPSDPTKILTVYGVGYRWASQERPERAPESERIVIGLCEIDLGLGLVRRDSREISLTTRQQAVLSTLLSSPGLCTREELYRKVWRRANYFRTRALDAVICQLRALIEPDPARPVHLRTVPREGYTLVRTPLRTNLAPPGPLVGRDEALAQLADALGKHRFVLVTGPPGVGKTHLAAQWCYQSTARAGGAWWVDCSAVRTTGELHEAIAQVLAADASLPALAARLRRMGAPALVLDEVEQIDGFAAAVEELLDAVSELQVVATSARSESVSGGSILRLDGLQDHAAQVLYLQSCGKERLSRDEREIIAATDGLPLALRLAAQRGAESGPLLSASISRAIHLAGPEGKRALDASLVFRGPFAIEALAAVATCPPSLVRDLVERCLLAPSEVGGLRPYQVLRSFFEPQRDPAVHLAHARWFSERARLWLSWWRTPQQDALREQSQRALDDLCAAGHYLADDDPESAAPIALLLATCDWLSRRADPLLERLIAIETPYPSLGRMWLMWAWRNEHDPGVVERATERARRFGVPEDDWTLRHLLCLAASVAGSRAPPGERPSRSSHAIDWMNVRAKQLFESGQTEEALCMWRQAARDARRHGDKIGELAARTLETHAMSSLQLSYAELSVRCERLSREWEAEGLLGAAARAACLAAHGAGMEALRARTLLERASALSHEAGDLRMINRCEVIRLWNEVGRLAPEVILARLPPIAALAAAQGDRKSVDRCATIKAFAQLRCDREIEPADDCLAVSILAAWQSRAAIPRARGWAEHLAEIVAHYRDAQPMTPGLSRALRNDVFLCAVYTFGESLCRRRTA